MEDKEVQKVLKKEYGVQIEPVNETEDMKGFVLVNPKGLAKGNAALQNLPYVLKSLYDQNHYVGAFKVICEKGTGHLQKAANGNYYRGNFVADGTNNHIVGQVLLEKLEPDTLMKISQVALSVYSVASILTSQYFLTQINEKLSTIDKNTAAIKRYLENEKKTEMLADFEYLQEKLSNITYIEQGPIYCQSVLSVIQQIRLRASGKMKFYREELLFLMNELSIKDQKKLTLQFFEKYHGLFPEYWFSVFLYEWSSYLEARLAGITDASFLGNIQKDMVAKKRLYGADVKSFKEKVQDYIDHAKSLNNNAAVELMLSAVGWIGGLAVLGISGASLGASAAKKMYAHTVKDPKEKTRSNIQKQFDELEKGYQNYEALMAPVQELTAIHYYANCPVEILFKDEKVYLKTEGTKQIKWIR